MVRSKVRMRKGDRMMAEVNSKGRAGDPSEVDFKTPARVKGHRKDGAITEVRGDHSGDPSTPRARVRLSRKAGTTYVDRDRVQVTSEDGVTAGTGMRNVNRMAAAAVTPDSTAGRTTETLHEVERSVAWKVVTTTAEVEEVRSLRGRLLRIRGQRSWNSRRR